MTVSCRTVARFREKDVVLFRIGNAEGSYAEILNYGATVVSIVVPDRDGCRENVILHYPDRQDYLSDTYYLGSTVGRVANRISGATFELGGKRYCLDKNDGKNSNHGGLQGFHTKIFDYKISGEKLLLTSESASGEGGYPGNLRFSVEYSFADDNSLHIIYRAETDSETIFSPTNHAYFNLSGKKEEIWGHELKINAERFLESDEEFLPTGKISELAATAYDFREYHSIGEMSALKKDFLRGYNTYFICRKAKNPASILASLYDPASGRNLDVYSSMPGVQLYTGDYLGSPFLPFQGVCLEAHFYPDALSHPGFMSCIVSPEQPFRQDISYVFSTLCR